MSKEKKAQIIDSLQETFSKCSVGILTDYRGLTVPQITGLRRKLGESGVEYKVVKNTLARFAAERAERADLAPSFVGPVAIAFGYGDIVEPARVLTDYIRTSNLELPIKGGFLVDRLKPLYVAWFLFMVRFYIMPLFLGYDVMGMLSFPLESEAAKIVYDLGQIFR